MMANKNESFFKDMGENWDAYREAIARYDYEHKEEIIMEHGISKGIMIGKEEGIMESNIKHVLNMYNKGYAIEDIADCVELSLLDVQNIIDTKCKENLD